ncbi:hypothetical protein AAU01_29160 [Paenarthrobacter aurescens]|uniref:Uncharacterized protein n=1 Tax=Paenarthrobacter aurescens TaxID=43663 RepID=A0A4Y3NMI4_PAEAU|nr:hypothetical protein AAU01_29160 [Paenarthrobacter aurescens]
MAIRADLAVTDELGGMGTGPRQPAGDEFLIKSWHALAIAFRAGSAPGGCRKPGFRVQSFQQTIVNPGVQLSMVRDRGTRNPIQQAQCLVHQGIPGEARRFRPPDNRAFRL